MEFWFYIGIVLFIWAVYDLFTGEVWLHRAVHRDSEPGMYWSLIIVWFLIAFWCLSYIYY